MAEIWMAVQGQGHEGDYEHVGPFASQKEANAFIKKVWGRLWSEKKDGYGGPNYFGVQWVAMRLTTVNEYEERGKT